MRGHPGTPRRSGARLAAAAAIALAGLGRAAEASGPADTGSAAAEAVWLDLPMRPGGPLLLELPIDGRLRTCELHPHSVRSPGYRLLVQGAGGDLVEHPPGPVSTMRGLLREVPGSVVTASLGAHGIEMTVHLPDDPEPIRVEPAGRGPRGAHLVHRNGVALASSLTCGFAGTTTASNPLPAARPVEPSGAGGVAGATECFWHAEIAFDADHLYFEKFGSVDGVEQRLNAVVNTLNPWYESDLEITHDISTIIVRTSAGDDPYSDTTNIGVLLQEFTNHWNANMQGVLRDMAQLVSDRVFEDPVSGASPVGNAFYQQVCTIGSYSVVRDVSGLACAAYVSAHELGHNWGSDHCACSADEGTGCPAGVCPPAADCFCPGWIMSASFACATAFNPDFTVPEMVAYRDTRTCIEFVCPPPPNDDCRDAVEVADGAHPFTTVGATIDGPPETVCSVAPFTGDVWYTYEAACEGVVLLDVCDSDFDTRLAVYGPACPGPEEPPLTCSDDACGQGSFVAVLASAGDRFHIRIGGDGNESGSGTLTVAGPTCVDCPTDTDGNGETDVDDLVAVILDWGTSGAANGGDVDGSGGVDVDDLVAVILAWGPC